MYTYLGFWPPHVTSVSGSVSRGSLREALNPGERGVTSCEVCCEMNIMPSVVLDVLMCECVLGFKKGCELVLCSFKRIFSPSM